MATNIQIKNQVDLDITNKISSNSITPVNVGTNVKSVVDYIDQEISNISLTPGPQGPAGANGLDGAIGANGTNGLDGATGPMGPQGPQGLTGPAGVGASQTLQETVDLGNTIDDGEGTVLSINSSQIKIQDVLGGRIKMEYNTGGKPTIEFGIPASGGLKTLLQTPDLQTGNRTIKLPNASGTLAIEKVKVSQQINVTSGEPEINTIDYVRVFANTDFQACKLTGPHNVGKEIYIKNTTAFNVVLNGIVENINGNGSLTLPPNTYWHLIKEDGGTNSITAFKLSLI